MAWDINKPQGIIGIAHVEIVSTAWALGFKKLQHPPVYYSFSRGVPIDVSRNYFAKELIKRKLDWVLMVDSDIIPQEDGLMKLLEASNKYGYKIIGGLYWKRHPVCHPSMWISAEKAGVENAKGKYVPLTPFYCKQCKQGLVNMRAAIKHKDLTGHEVVRSWNTGDIVECDVIGMGFTLIKREVFEAIDEPYFYFEHGRVENGVSEDFYFCEKARSAGYKIAVHTGVLCKHLVRAYIEPETGELQFIEV